MKTMTQKVTEYYGVKTIDDVLKKINWCDSVYPGFCVNKDCNYVEDMLEPDGYCDCPDCGKKVKSLPMLFGII